MSNVQLEQAANALCLGIDLTLFVFGGMILLIFGVAGFVQWINTRRINVGDRVCITTWNNPGTVIARCEPYITVDGRGIPQVKVKWDESGKEDDSWDCHLSAKFTMGRLFRIITNSK